MSQAGIINVADSILPPDVPLEFISNNGTGSAIANVFEILGTGNVSTSIIGNVLTISAVVTDFTWNTVTSASPANPISLVAQNGYITTGASQVTFILPVSAAVGDTFIISDLTSLFQINQNANQSIIFGSKVTTLGVGGSISSLNVGDHLEILCVQANLTFKIIDSMGNLTIV